MTRLGVALLCLLGLWSAVAAAPLSQRQLAEAFVKALTKAQPDAQVTIKANLEVAIRYPDGGEHIAYLDNAYAMVRDNPANVQSVLDTMVAALGETRASKASAIDRERIVPVVKDRAWLRDIQATLKASGKDGKDGGFHNVVEDLNDELVIVYAQDTPKNIDYFSAQSFAASGISSEGLRALAVANLRRMIRDPQISKGEHAGIIRIGGTYEASLLLFDDLWETLAKPVGERVVAIPTRDVLIYTDSADAEGVAFLRDAAAKLAGDSPYRLTPTLFVRRNGRFVRYP